MRDEFLKTLSASYRAKYSEHELALKILMDKCVGISEHTNFIEEADKHIEKMANVIEKQEVVDCLIHDWEK